MGQREKRSRRNWPRHLVGREKGSITYYSYRDPVTKKETGIGTQLDAAIHAVTLINRKRAENPIQTIITRIEQPARTWSQHLSWYEAQILPTKKLAKSSAYNWTLALKIFKENLGGDIDVAQIDRQRVATFLGACKPRMSNVYRGYLHTLFKYAVAEGLRNDNPVEQTIKRAAEVQRTRLAMIDYNNIYARAEPWLQRAMDLALWSLQRRDDLVHMTEAHWHAGKLTVRQKKVARHGTGLLRITPGPKLKAALISCLNSNERKDCPYLIHRPPIRKIKSKGRTHDRQVNGDLLTREFAAVRDTLKKFQSMPAAERPTFHELRSLGGDQYRKLGWPAQQIQDLMGHANKDLSPMTKHYLDGHGERWLEVAAA